MWNWFNCYLSGRHDFGVWCEPGAIFLRCIHCGKRSSGWAIDAHVSHPHAPKTTEAPADRAVPARVRGVRAASREPRAVVHAIDAPAAGARVLPFDRVVVQ
jgi:hypothetical protein